MGTADGQNPAPLGKKWEPLFVGICMGITIPGLLRWCEMDFVHPYVRFASAAIATWVLFFHLRLNPHSRGAGKIRGFPIRFAS